MLLVLACSLLTEAGAPAGLVGSTLTRGCDRLTLGMTQV
jgi:hypothetical protein